VIEEETSMNARIATTTVCVVAAAIFALRPAQVVNASANQAGGARSVTLARPNKPPTTSEMATISALPTLGRGLIAEALSVNAAGTVIVGSAWDRDDLLHGVTWTLQNGTWAIAALPTPPDATSAIARGAGDAGAGGNDFPGTRSRAMFWPWTGGFQVLGCNDDLGPATVYGISRDGQVVVGVERSPGTARAALWPTTPGACRVDLPPLVAGVSASAHAVNGDGTLVGGSSNGFPVRWTLSSGQWQIAQLDNRLGWASGANAIGDLAGNVEVSNGTAGCTLSDGCQRAVIWHAQGGALEPGTLGGAHSWARDVNASGEVVGGSTSPQIGNTGFFWSPSVGMYQLPVSGQWAAANAVSDVRPDGTRLVVGMNSKGLPVVWVVRSP
jgi:uncharacterized membrane protein